MHTDRQGNRLTGATSEAVTLFDEAVEAFNIYTGDPIALADSAIAAAPECTMAHIFKAYAYGLATEPDATAEAITIAGHAKSLRMDERERSLLGALDMLLANNWTAAAVALDYHTMHYPHDMLGLQAGLLMDFYRGNARNLRDRIARVLPYWSEDRPGYGIVLGMYAFGLEETGDYARAEAMGCEAVARQPLDCWAHHAVAHVMEMQGRAADGITWMQSREPHWSGADNFFKVHNWWHNAVFHMEMGLSDAVLRIYDEHIRDGNSTVALDLIDAAALLWRAHVQGIDVGDRWDEVAACWDQHADGKLYPFNDWHAAMAYLGADRTADVERLLGGYRQHAPEANETARWAKETGLPLIEGFAAFWHKDYTTAVERLHRARFIANSFGGSHAQRDIIDWTLTEAAIRAGMKDVAAALANERLGLKPHSPINRRYLARSQALVTQETAAPPVLAA